MNIDNACWVDAVGGPVVFWCGRDSSWKPQARTQVDLSRVDRVQTGQRTRKFSRFSDKHRSVNGHSLSLIYGESLRRGLGRGSGWAGQSCRPFWGSVSAVRASVLDSSLRFGLL